MRSRLTVLVVCMMAMVSVSLRQVPVQASAACPNVVNQGSANSSVFAADCATVAGGENNQATDSHSTVGGGDGNLASNRWSTVGGGEENQASGNSATVGGGGLNPASGSSATVGGGANNVASGFVATVGGGIYNEASASRATIGGGANNAASALAATVGGGYFNQATASYATIAGGGPADPKNVATANRVTDVYGTVGGGGNNQAGNNAGTTTDRPYATVAGGRTNTASGSYAAILGGSTNTATRQLCQRARWLHQHRRVGPTAAFWAATSTAWQGVIRPSWAVVSNQASGCLLHRRGQQRTSEPSGEFRVGRQPELPVSVDSHPSVQRALDRRCALRDRC